MTTRATLPHRRAATTCEVKHGQQSVTVTVGYYADGSLGEVFVTAPKVGSSLEAIARDAAVLLSIAAQFGVPLDTLRHAVTREQDGSPSSIIGAVLDRLWGSNRWQGQKRSKTSGAASVIRARASWRISKFEHRSSRLTTGDMIDCRTDLMLHAGSVAAHCSIAQRHSFPASRSRVITRWDFACGAGQMPRCVRS